MSWLLLVALIAMGGAGCDKSKRRRARHTTTVAANPLAPQALIHPAPQGPSGPAAATTPTPDIHDLVARELVDDLAEHSGPGTISDELLELISGTLPVADVLNPADPGPVVFPVVNEPSPAVVGPPHAVLEPPTTGTDAPPVPLPLVESELCRLVKDSQSPPPTSEGPGGLETPAVTATNPEPGTLLLLAMGSASGAVLLRRRRFRGASAADSHASAD
ncbi:MAG: PEP-CTERM sorting domain-containing protein [Planctomyces sp.]|nr:PEP-CTERM sorting domain-containing protein [Planctomyces sp.]